MNSLANRIFSFALVALVTTVVIFSISSREQAGLTKTEAHVAGRNPSAYFGNFSAKPERMKLDEVCRENSECSQGLSCLYGICRKPDSNNRGWVGDNCSGPGGGLYECVSGVCTNGFCSPSFKDKAGNGYSCDSSAAFLCRSGVCRDGQCAPSFKHPGLPGASCESLSDCLSASCQSADEESEKRCGYVMSRAASCAVVGTFVNSGLECCSGTMDGLNHCAPIADPGCTDRGECAGSVGRLCADLGWDVISPTQCCSGRSLGTKCVIDTQKKYQPCRLNRSCRSGFCDQTTNLCTSPYRGKNVEKFGDAVY